MSTVFIAGLLSLPRTVSAAQDGSVRGVVTDSADVPIAAADVSIVALHRLTRTDEQGLFAFDQLPLGRVELSVRHIGFQPQVVSAVVSGAVNYLYSVALSTQPAVLGPMLVDGAEQRLRLGIEGFYQRRTRGIGTYFTRDEIVRRGAKTTSDVFRWMPGIQLVRVNGGHGIRLASTGLLRRNCIPMLWIDGQHAGGLEVDDIPVNDVEAVEFYRGPSTTPPQFWQGTTMECGTVVIWSRIPPP